MSSAVAFTALLAYFAIGALAVVALNVVVVTVVDWLRDRFRRA